ncbi:hypothetical protein J2808_004438 [Pseudarthrobacter sulfonivorans]|nr:hypothetical protein [Pseudarthrobacter sulfonivorans]
MKGTKTADVFELKELESLMYGSTRWKEDRCSFEIVRTH